MVPARLFATAIAVALGAAALGCQGNVATPFPPGLEPFPDDHIPLDLPATPVEMLSVRAFGGDTIRVYARGFVFAPPAAVWAATRVPEAMIARCRTTAQTITRDNQPQYELSFLVHYRVDDILTVEWEDQWRGGVIVGDTGDPEHVMIKHQKVMGSGFIDLSEGTIQLYATSDPGITELRFVEHLKAISGSANDVAAGTRDNYAAILGLVHAGVIPPCH